MPCGIGSSTSKPVSGSVLLLAIVNTTVPLPFNGIVDGANALLTTGAEKMVSVDTDVFPVPPFDDPTVTLLPLGPGVIVPAGPTRTENTHWSCGARVTLLN